jgi:hypothetical protein
VKGDKTQLVQVHVEKSIFNNLNENTKYSQCEVTQSWRVENGVIRPIISGRNRPNELGIKHKFGKRKGQLKKNKLVTKNDLEAALAEA